VTVNWPRAHPGLAAVAVVALVLLVVWIGKLVQVGRGIEQAREYWSQPRGQSGGLLYVALGDSAAQGVGASQPDRGYVGQLAQRLRDATGQPVQVINLSVSGAKIEDLVSEQLPKLDGVDADLVTVAVGGNDMLSADPDGFEAAVDRLTAALPTGALIADVPYFMHGRWERNADAAAALVRSAATRENLTPVPLHAAQERRGWGAMLTDFSADWFHPNDRGHGVWADAFWQALTQSATGERLGAR
jgi:acyl-CoA thioesterase I